MTYEEWVEQFRPEKNNIVSQDRGYDGTMFETFGPEVEFVKTIGQMNPHRVWTLVSGDNGGLYITDGWHFVNRLGYFITALPYEGPGIEICVGDPDRFEVSQAQNGFDWTVNDVPSGKPVCSIPIGYQNAEEIAEGIAEALNSGDYEFDLTHDDDEDEPS